MKIVICGAGAIGSWLSTYLSVDTRGTHEITILDRDLVEERNIIAGTQNYFREQIGIPKVEALQFNIHKQFQREIKTVYQEIGYGKWPQEDDSGEPLEPNITIDCLDNYISRKAIQGNWAYSSPIFPKTKNPYELLHIGFSDQFTFAIEWAENYEAPEDNPKARDICELPGASSFVNMVAAIGSSVVQEYLTTGKKREFCGGKFLIREVK